MTTRIEPHELIQRLGVEGLCKTADDYFAEFTAEDQSNYKPFGTMGDAPQCLKNLGDLLGGLELGVGMTVLDFGAGTAWLTRALSGLGVQMIALDPSRKALALGERLAAVDAEREPRYPRLAPRFLPFDGFTIELEDESVDRVVAFDAFHHVPNPQEVLCELFRVLRPGGLVGMSEPGAQHAYSPQSQAEMRRHDVLENNIDPQRFAGYAHRAGFSEVWSLAHFEDSFRLTPEERASVVEDRVPEQLQRALFSALRGSLGNRSITFVRKGAQVLDSRRAVGLAYEVVEMSAPEAVSADQAFEVKVTWRNAGPATWRTEGPRDFGVVFAGLRIAAVDGTKRSGELVRARFPGPVAPGEVAAVAIPVPPMESPGSYELEVDLVAEQVAWFVHCGSEPRRCVVQVS
jgi:SAM-dependent methyltransferase